MVFNFDRPDSKDFTETARLLAGLSSFVIADITNPRSTPLELQAVVPEYMVPFVTVLEEGEEPFAMFQDLWQQIDELGHLEIVDGDLGLACRSDDQLPLYCFI